MWICLLLRIAYPIFRGIVLPKMEIVSFAHPLFVPNLYDFFLPRNAGLEWYYNDRFKRYCSCKHFHHFIQWDWNWHWSHTVTHLWGIENLRLDKQNGLVNKINIVFFQICNAPASRKPHKANEIKSPSVVHSSHPFKLLWNGWNECARSKYEVKHSLKSS